MSYTYDAKGTKPNAYSLIPDGWYLFRIEEIKGTGVLKDTNSYYVRFRTSVAAGRHKGRSVFHFQSFPPPDSEYAPRSLYFLKSIGQPCEGQFEISPRNWLDGCFYGRTIIQKDRSGQYPDQNRIVAVKSCDEYEVEISQNGKNQSEIENESQDPGNPEDAFTGPNPDKKQQPKWLEGEDK